MIHIICFDRWSFCDKYVVILRKFLADIIGLGALRVDYVKCIAGFPKISKRTSMNEIGREHHVPLGRRLKCHPVGAEGISV
jgi:hypothetical protein